jgi:hypothetical protein
MKEKNYYVSPLCESLELQTEGVIAASKAPKWNSPFNPEQDW